MVAYVVKSWSVTNQPNPQGNYVEIHGRASGLLAWLMNTIGISPTVALVVRADKAILQERSLEGTSQYSTPLENVCATLYGYRRPIKEAIALGVVVGGATFFLAGIPGIIIAILYYVLNKTLTVGFTDVGGRLSVINFKRSVIEGQSIDEASAKYVCDLIEDLIDFRRQRPLGH